jgi:hypothetical protein
VPSTSACEMNAGTRPVVTVNFDEENCDGPSARFLRIVYTAGRPKLIEEAQGSRTTTCAHGFGVHVGSTLDGETNLDTVTKPADERCWSADLLVP